ncbi:MAG: Gfo/Idh/MocA family oxidoreductase [Eubacteriales bacterium]|nr:Gfo/Idh/MocA family oxidoreductase [Eubacteriales bacterium]
MKQFKKMRTALIGCGMISKTYLENCCKRFNIFEMAGCSDIIPERSAARAQAYGIKQMTNEEIFADPSIELVINTTYQMSHYTVSKQALLSGKHVYSEKMMAVTFEQGKELDALAKERGLFMGCAPDTFMGAGLQTSRVLLDSGIIGTPVSANAIIVRGYHHERMRTEAEKRFAFCPGGGIIYDVGCYYLTALVNLLGPIRRVCGFSQTRDPGSRIYRHPANPLYGDVMTIETPNNTAGTLEFENGVLCVILTSSESVNVTNSFIIYGTEGKIVLNDPNTFGGPVYVQTKMGEAKEMPLTHAYTDNVRALGAADLAYAIRNGRAPRANAATALHTLEAALGIGESGETGRIYSMTTSAERAAPLEAGYIEYPEMVLDI